MKKLLLLLSTGCLMISSSAQTDTIPVLQDSTSSQTLKEVVVTAFEQNRRLMDIPASVGYIGKAQLERFNNTSILPAINSIPGVRMEERSPGSYRLNIRGSSLRSPFGVRNVKVYWNDIPFTDPGGNTYLNQLGFYNVSSVEVIKGPASSIYGAGTGGAVLLKSQPAVWERSASVNYFMGSFNNRGLNVSLRTGSENFQNTLNYSTQQSDGYRVQSGVERKVLTYESKIKTSEKNQLNVFFLYGDLYYQTPGGLTKAQFEADPRAARPAAGPSPSAVQAKAAITQKTFLSGFSNRYQITKHFENITSLYGAFSQIRNPTIRNYEKRNEPHFGGRTVFKYNADMSGSILNIVLGAEAQKGFSNVKVYGNRAGVQDTVQTDDEVSNLQYFIFTQADLELKNGWIITAGASFNKSSIEFSRVSVIPPVNQKRTYNNEIAPRLSILKHITPGISAYAGISKGFSPPTLAELLPSTGVINTALEAEDGTNYETGLRGSFLRDKLFINVNGFIFQLKNTLAQRRDASGADYFENAGSTKQAGIETNINYLFVNDNRSFINRSGIWISHTWNKFTYKDYKQVNTDLSGKKLPSVAPHVFSAGLDINTKPGVYTNITWYYSDPVPLNDANTDVASSFNLLGARLGFRKTIASSFYLDIYGSVDNIFNVTYSLGNDINAVGGRYYNAAPGINYTGGISLKYIWK